MFRFLKFHQLNRFSKTERNVVSVICYEIPIKSSEKKLPIIGHWTTPTRNFVKTASLQSLDDSLFTKEVDYRTFEKVCEETLESLTDFFEELLETKEKLAAGDVSYSSGVLTVNLGKFGTYVINRQSPNKQIWLSSPISGPKRYDYVADGSYWLYKHETRALHELLQSEISSILGEDIDLRNCLHAKT